MRGLEIQATDQLEGTRTSRAKFGAAMKKLRRYRERLAPENLFTAAVQAHHADLLRHDQLDRLEGKIFAVDVCVTKQVLVAKMRALVVDPDTCAEAGTAERHGQTDQIIRIDQIVGGARQIELRENTARHVQLQPFIRLRSAPADESKIISNSHRRDRGATAGGITERPECTSQHAHERACFFGIREYRTED